MPATAKIPSRTNTSLVMAAAGVRDAEQALRRARDRLDSAIYDAVKRRGCQPTAVAAAAGVSRETVYKAAGRGDPQTTID